MDESARKGIDARGQARHEKHFWERSQKRAGDAPIASFSFPVEQPLILARLAFGNLSLCYQAGLERKQG